MRELSFGARIADSFVKKLKWETAKAIDESPGVLPCLCLEERTSQHFDGDKEEAQRTDISQAAEVPAINRLAPPAHPRFRPPIMVVREQAWILRFEKRRPSAKVLFQIDQVELHISERAQAALKGATIEVVNDRIVVRYDRT